MPLYKWRDFNGSGTCELITAAKDTCALPNLVTFWALTSVFERAKTHADERELFTSAQSSAKVAGAWQERQRDEAGPIPSPTAHADSITAPSGKSFALWGPIVALGIVDWILADHDRLMFVGWTSVVLGVGFLTTISLFYGLTGRSRRLADAARYAALWVAFSAVGVVFTYLMADLRMPLWDARLARIDAALGFNWPAWFSLVNAHALLKYPLELAYNSLLLQIVFCVIYLSHVQRPERMTSCSGWPSYRL